jgi:hypothetical protein
MMDRHAATFWLSTPAPGVGGADAAIAAFEVRGDVEGVFAALGVAPVPVGQARLRALGDIDHGVIARWATDAATIMPHAGPAVLAALDAWLAHAASGRFATCSATSLDEAILHAEAADVPDALQPALQAALNQLGSPMGLEVLLDQPKRWQAWAKATAMTARAALPEHPSASALSRLLRPALVAIVGPPNIGKSSLLNALAGRTVALVADAPGTTRDSVGVGLILDGLLVRYVDTPGLSDTPRDALDAEAQRAAHAMLARTDLLLLAADARHPETLAPMRQRLAHAGAAPAMEVLLRGDLASGATFAAAGDGPIMTSSHRGDGLAALARAIRTMLLPDAALRDGTPWRFWSSFSPR